MIPIDYGVSSDASSSDSLVDVMYDAQVGRLVFVPVPLLHALIYFNLLIIAILDVVPEAGPMGDGSASIVAAVG